MKKIFARFSVLVVLALFAGFSFGQTADEIIVKYVDANGGPDKLVAIQSMKVTGNFTGYSERYPCKAIKARGGKYFSEHHLGQFPVVDGSDGETCWMEDPWFELRLPHKSNEAEAFETEQKAEFCTPFFNYKERGFEVSYEGIEQAEGKDCYKLILTRTDGKEETWFLDKETYLEVLSISLWSDFGRLTESETFYDDFRKIGDVLLPFYSERVFSIRHRVFEIENIELNVDPGPSIFEFPLYTEMQKLMFMVGNWNVVLESRDRSGGLQFPDSTTSEIKLMDGKNLLQENISYISYFPVEKIITWSYNSDLESYLMTSFNSFYSNIDFFIGNFSEDTLMGDNIHVKFNDEAKEQLARYSILKKRRKYHGYEGVTVNG